MLANKQPISAMHHRTTCLQTSTSSFSNSLVTTIADGHTSAHFTATLQLLSGSATFQLLSGSATFQLLSGSTTFQLLSDSCLALAWHLSGSCLALLLLGNTRRPHFSSCLSLAWLVSGLATWQAKTYRQAVFWWCRQAAPSTRSTRQHFMATPLKLLHLRVLSILIVQFSNEQRTQCHW